MLKFFHLIIMLSMPTIPLVISINSNYIISKFSNQTNVQNVEVYKMAEFPSTKIALHFPCEESNMFATKCMCHIRCTDSSCRNAKRICEKYSTTKGCKYMLLRGGNNKIATLKRAPTTGELQHFETSRYPSSYAEQSQDKIIQNFRRSTIPPIPNLSHLLKNNENKGNAVLNHLIQLYKTNTDKYCVVNNQQLLNKNDEAKWQSKFLSTKIGLVALNYHSPMTLYNTLRTWNTSGLLNMVAEKIIILNDPFAAELAMSLDFGLRVVQPRDIPNAKMSKPNVFTIGAAFYYSLHQLSTEYVLFLENDFKMDMSLTTEEIKSELLMAAGMLDRGVEIVRFMSRKTQGCGTFKSCDHGGIHLEAADPMERKRNWYAFYCPGWKGTEKLVSDCSIAPDIPRFRCFTSWDSNWSLNAVMVKRSTMLTVKYPVQTSHKTIAEIGLSHFDNQDGFEGAMGFGIRWMKWRLPICISYNGLFIHEEIETSA